MSVNQDLESIISTDEAAPNQVDELSRWTNHQERVKAIENYTQIIKEADQTALAQINDQDKQVRQAYRFSMATYGILFLIVIAVFFFLYILLQKEQILIYWASQASSPAFSLC